jgi:hypothetical protein
MELIVFQLRKIFGPNRSFLEGGSFHGTRKLFRGSLTAQNRAKAGAAWAAGPFFGPGVRVGGPGAAVRGPGAGRRGHLVGGLVAWSPGTRSAAWSTRCLHAHANTATRSTQTQTRPRPPAAAPAAAPGAKPRATSCSTRSTRRAIPGARTTGQLAEARGAWHGRRPCRWVNGARPGGPAAARPGPGLIPETKNPARGRARGSGNRRAKPACRLGRPARWPSGRRWPGRRPCHR